MSEIETETALNVMLDLETFSTTQNAAIIQIGAVAFLDFLGETEIWERFSRNVTLQSSMSIGCAIEAETIEWWNGQESFQSVVGASGAVPIWDAMQDFNDWWDGIAVHGPVKVWSHGASFDVAILRNAYDACGMSVPWKYSDVRDTRTVFDIAESHFGWVPPSRAVTHVAVEDAAGQVVRLVSAMCAIRDGSDKYR